MGPQMNKQDLSYAGGPLLTGDNCLYKFHEEFNTLLVTCHNSEGQLVGHQVRQIQNPIKKCAAVKDQFLPAFSVNEFFRFYLKGLSSTNICCDFYERGFGYLFTSCGGSEVIIFKEKISDQLSQ